MPNQQKALPDPEEPQLQNVQTSNHNRGEKIMLLASLETAMCPMGNEAVGKIAKFLLSSATMMYSSFRRFLAYLSSLTNIAFRWAKPKCQKSL